MLSYPATLSTRTICSSSHHYAPVLTAMPAMPSALVYCGPGAGFRSALSAMHSLKAALVDRVKVERLTTEQLLASRWQEGCLVLVLPGGADLPYCEHLNGRGNSLIREYVEGGGAYLGLCAGGYYGCSRVEFEPGTRLEVVGDRELAFFPGVARGSIYQGFQYESENGAAAARVHHLDFCSPAASPVLGAPLSEGGPAPPESAAAAGACPPAAAAGAAAAAAPPASWRQAGNGTAAARRAAAAVAEATVQLQPVQPEGGATPLSTPEAQQAQQGAEEEQCGGSSSSEVWRYCTDYINGGPGFFAPNGGSLLDRPPPGVHVLATYPDRGGAAASLLCRVGRGRAVLSGTHPELHPSWLEPCLRGGGNTEACSDRAQRDGGGGGRGGAAVQAPEAVDLRPAGGLAALQGAQQRQESSGGGTASGDARQTHTAAAAAAAAMLGGGVQAEQCADPAVQHVRQLHAQLASNQAARWRYWRGLLVAAGLPGWLRQDEGDAVLGLTGPQSMPSV